MSRELDHTRAPGAAAKATAPVSVRNQQPTVG